MFCVMRILKLANGEPSDCDGRFIKSFLIANELQLAKWVV
jgi:hypothetical protein